MKGSEELEQESGKTDDAEQRLLERLVEEVCRERRDLAEVLAALSGLTAAVLSIRSRLQQEKL